MIDDGFIAFVVFQNGFVNTEISFDADLPVTKD